MKFKKLFFTLCIYFLSIQIMQGQTPDSTKHYLHKVVVDSVIQTKAYSYMKVREVYNGKDSLQWMALPLFNPKVGEVFYFDGGLQMGEFHSKELDRTFDQINFIGYLSTSLEVSEKTIVPKPVIDTIPIDAPPVLLHTVLVKEVIQAGGYTYLRVDEEGKEEWIAIVKQQANPGEYYTYEDATPMKQFKSRELERTFDEVLFVAKLTRSESVTGQEAGKRNSKLNVAGKSNFDNNSSSKRHGKSSANNKVIKLSSLFKNKEFHTNKIVRVSGEVTKFNANILGKNWIHLEDGSSVPGKSDILITMEEEVAVGDKIIVEGQFTVDRDFGSGYKFDVMIENAKLIK
jgi:hypothetical protein